MTIETADTINTTRVQTGQAAGSIDPVDIQTIVNSAFGMPISRTITASGTAALTDRGSLVELNVTTTANTLSIPTNASVPFDVGTVIGVRQMGTGVTSFVAVTPATTTLISSTGTFSCRTRYAAIFAHKRAADEWVVYGELT